MAVDSTLELYTTLFGWLFYNSIWDVLVATGIVFLPFLGILLDTIIRSYAGEDAEEAGNTTLRIVEVEFFVAFFVILDCSCTGDTAECCRFVVYSTRGHWNTCTASGDGQ